MRTTILPGLVAFLWLTVQPVSAQYLLRLDFQQMDPYIGKRLVTRVVEAATGDEVGRKTIESIPDDVFTFDLYCLFFNKSYVVYYWIDVNASGDYDAPPTDHAWQQLITDIDQNTLLIFTPDENYVDAGLPDAFPYSQYDATWGGRWENLTFGSTDSIQAGMEITCDSFYGFFSTKGIFGNPATFLFDTSGALSGGALPDTISFGIDPPWTGQVQIVDGEINADLGLIGTSLQFIGTLGAKQILCFYEVYVGGNFIAAGYFYLRELEIHSSAPDLEIELNANAEVSCFDAADGFLETNAFGGTPGYTYNWSNGDTTALIVNLSGGDYSLTVTDADGCQTNADYSVSEPPQLVATWFTTQVTCFGLCDGSIDLIMTGGVPPYMFVWSTGSASEDLTGLCAGAYELTIVDATGCSATTVISIAEPPILAITSSTVINETDGAANGSIEVAITGGSPPYSHSWEKDGVFFSSDEDIFNLSAGTYILHTTDMFNCLLVSGPFMIENTVGISGIQTHFSLFPNPVSDKLYLASDDPVKIELLTIDGKIMEVSTWATAHDINLKGLAKGMYCVKISDKHGLAVKKVILH